MSSLIVYYVIFVYFNKGITNKYESSRVNTTESSFEALKWHHQSNVSKALATAKQQALPMTYTPTSIYTF